MNEIKLSCRLCDGDSKFKFNLFILKKYNVSYYECSDCSSLQTEYPNWLDQAYKYKNLSNIDTGAAQRNIDNHALCFAVSKVLQAKNVIDIGGGDGLLCRLLRDHSINCYIKDKYAENIYAQGFTKPDFLTPDLITGFEVLEHFSNPKVDLDELFSTNANSVLISTILYSGETKNWWYLTPESGQHVFFYSRKGIDFIGKKYGYKSIINGSYTIFFKEIPFYKILILKMLLNRYAMRISKILIMLLPANGAWQDYKKLIKN